MHGDLHGELLCALREELAGVREELTRCQLDAVREKLDQLAYGQSVLTAAVENINRKLTPVPDTPEPYKSRIQSGVQDWTVPVIREPYKSRLQSEVQDLSAIEFSSQTSMDSRKSLSRRSMLKQSGAEEFARLYKQSERYLAESAEKKKQKSPFQRLRLMNTHTKDLILDEVVVVVVVLNAIFLGVSSDYWNGEINIYCLIDVLFTVVFFIELLAKVTLHGISGSFCPMRRKLQNNFDLILVVLDTAQLVIVIFFKDATDKMRDAGIPSASLFRICRVLRVARILRILRHAVFEDLLAMFEAVFSGLRTLLWAVVLFFLVVYVVALLCRDVLGNYPQYADIFPYFSSVPRSFFTVFRCSFGDCSSRQGTPIPESVHESFGSAYSFFYCSCLFFVTIGLFNIISAIFVDRTMMRAAKSEAKLVKEQLVDEKLWATRVSVLVRQCFVKMGYEQELDNLQQLLENHAEIPVDVVDAVCRCDPEATAALNDLGIDEYDHSVLAKILDYDSSGSVSLHQLIHGLHQLRGLPRRTDVIQNYFCLQGIQHNMEDVSHKLAAVAKSSSKLPKFTTRSSCWDMSYSRHVGIEEDGICSAKLLPMDAATEAAPSRFNL